MSDFIDLKKVHITRSIPKEPKEESKFTYEKDEQALEYEESP